MAFAFVLPAAGCAVGPDYRPPRSDAPADWPALRTGDASLRDVGATVPASAAWWKTLGDPVLDGLIDEALVASPDLQTAALRFAQSRAQRRTIAATRGPEVDLSAGAQRQRPSANGAMTRTVDVLAPGDRRDALIGMLTQPYDLYQGGFDASWEPDFWGRVRRAVEAADAPVQGAAALADGARLDVAAEVARTYIALRGTQRQIVLARADLDAARDRFGLVTARADGGMESDLDATRQQALLADLQARLPPLLADEATAKDQIARLLGRMPGADLDARLGPAGEEATPPSLPLGVPSEVARRRPDIRAAEADLHAATADIGVAVADLYPRIRLGASVGVEAIHASDAGDWASRRWSVGPSLSVPIFDMGRRRGEVTLRTLRQQEAAVAYQKAVLQAFSEIDARLAGYAAERQRNAHLRERERLAADADRLAGARYRAGRTSFIEALDAERSLIAARNDRVRSDAALASGFVALCKAIGGGDPGAGG